jgi:hypothetical protein
MLKSVTPDGFDIEIVKPLSAAVWNALISSTSIAPLSKPYINLFVEPSGTPIHSQTVVHSPFVGHHERSANVRTSADLAAVVPVVITGEDGPPLASICACRIVTPLRVADAASQPEAETSGDVGPATTDDVDVVADVAVSQQRKIPELLISSTIPDVAPVTVPV